MSTIIKRKLLTTKEKTSSINYKLSSKIVKDHKSEVLEKNISQNVFGTQISEKFVQWDRGIDSESVQVRQFCY